MVATIGYEIPAVIMLISTSPQTLRAVADELEGAVLPFFAVSCPALEDQLSGNSP